MPISVERHNEIYEEIRAGEIRIVWKGSYISPPLYRFWAQVDKAGPIHPVLGTRCWEWTGGQDQGYGRLTVRGVQTRAHRYSYTLYNGPIPDSLNVCHRCDRPSCVQPNHLFVGTDADNVADMVAKGRQAAGNRHGSVTHPESRATGERHGQHTHPERTARGEANGQAKLSEEQVREIRRRCRKGCRVNGQVALAREYGVSQALISLIILGEAWTHVT